MPISPATTRFCILGSSSPQIQPTQRENIQEKIIPESSLNKQTNKQSLNLSYAAKESRDDLKFKGECAQILCK